MRRLAHYWHPIIHRLITGRWVAEIKVNSRVRGCCNRRMFTFRLHTPSSKWSIRVTEVCACRGLCVPAEPWAPPSERQHSWASQ
jgi:hypothetical protein